jgi:3-oxoacyl-[acyl-carrier protein] reductase
VTDRTAFVTGAGSGLGRAIALRLAADGHHVVVNDLDRSAAGRVAAETHGQAAPFDVTDADAFDRSVDAVVAEHGRLDVMVNNAGILIVRDDVAQRTIAAGMAAMGGDQPEPVAALSSLSDTDWDRTIKVHLYGTFFGTRAALRHMEPARSGAIVNLASIYGLNGSTTVPEYAAAKHGIVGLTRSVGAEVAPLGIRVNAVAPGFVDTPLLAPLDEIMRAVVQQRIPAGRFGRPDEVAELVAYLASDRASYCFGEVLPITGGATG